MNRLLRAAAICAPALLAGAGGAQAQYPILDAVAEKVIQTYRVQAAWAGPTLVVTTRHGDVLAFPSLAHALREAGEGRSQK